MAKVLMALSGGVDSAVCVRLLQRQGYEVEGLVIRFSPAHDGAVLAAQKAAAELGVALTVAHAEDDFDAHVALPFCEAYAAGRTPNPCVMCNPLVKFATLLREAERMGIPYIATGHYARVARWDDIFYVARAESAARDQSYMLYRLGQPVLSRLLMPAGELEKGEIRALAGEVGLSCADAPDSQEICFIPDGDYAAYMKVRGFSGAQGCFIGPDGEDLGPHLGVEHYTVGQRRGIGVSFGLPVFVKAIDGDGNVRLTYEEGTLSSGLTLAQTVAADGALEAGAYDVKIRSMAAPVPCALAYDGGIPTVRFEAPQRSPAPGQHAVLYREGLVMGGGVIDTILA